MFEVFVEFEKNVVKIRLVKIMVVSWINLVVDVLFVVNVG